MVVVLVELAAGQKVDARSVGADVIVDTRVDPLTPHNAIFVRSEYHPGQFTDGRLNDGMAYVCVPGHNIDCEWAEGVEIGPHDHVVTKYHADAGETAVYRDTVERAIAGGATLIALAGFQFTTCVAASAASTASMVRGRGVRVAVVEPLTGSRASSHVPGASGVSRMDATRRDLERAGVEVVRGLGVAWPL